MNEVAPIFFSLATLIFLEVILGIDNLVFLAIISEKLPRRQRSRARKIGLILAWMSRLVLLASAYWLTRLKTPLFSLFNKSFSIHDLLLLGGGLFLLAKATQEIHHDFEFRSSQEKLNAKLTHMGVVVSQIALLDMVFSLDSVLTAIGLTPHFWVMALSITIAIVAMLFASEPLSQFIERYPTLKMLALSFLILIGMVLIADGVGFHIPRPYVYFAMGFSLFVETLNILKRRKAKRG